MKDNVRDVYSVIWGQCSLPIQAKMKQEVEFKSKNDDKDSAWLLNQIKSAVYKFDSKRDIFYSISEARTNLEYTRQQKESDEEFYDTFKSHVEAFEHFGGSIGNDEGFIEEVRDATDMNNPGDMPEGDTATTDQLVKWIKDSKKYEKKLRAKARERYLAMMF